MTEVLGYEQYVLQGGDWVRAILRTLCVTDVLPRVAL